DGRTLLYTSDRSPAVKYPRAAAQAATDVERLLAWDDGESNIWAISLAPWIDPAEDSVSKPAGVAPGGLSGPANEASPTFTPDGKTVVFTRHNSDDYTLLTSHQRNGAWSTPEALPFSGRWRDLEPTMSPDGSYLIFASSRPLPGTTQPPDGFW